MPAALSLDTDMVTLGEVTIGTAFEHGEARRISVRNSGDTVLREISVGLEGDGASFVQLARDSEGPGVWADRGQSINVSGEIFPGDSFVFWARGIFSPEDREGNQPFDFNIEALSVA